MGLFDKLKSALGPAVQKDPENEGNGREAVATPDFQPSCDTLHFDFEADPCAWYIVDRQAERFAEDPEKLARLFAEQGIRDWDHYRELHEAFRDYQEFVIQTQGTQAWRELQQTLVDAEQAAITGEYRQTFDASCPDLLEPIEGVSIQDYGRITASMMGGKALEEILPTFQMDRAKYDRVSEAWNQRMAQDTTFTLTGEYSKAFMPTANAAVGMEGEPTITWEQTIEAMMAMDAGTAAGLDPQGVLHQLGMTLGEYVTASNHWGEWFNRNALRDPSLLEQHTQLTEKYRAKYALAKQDRDISF